MEHHHPSPWKKWVSDCLKGVVGAVIATLLLAILQYLGAHISDIVMFGSKLVGAFGAVRFSNRV